MILRFAKTTTLLCALGAMTACAPNADGSTSNIFSDIQTLANGGTGAMSPQQRELQQRSRDYASSRVGAAVGGALLGGLICGLAGCSTEETVAAAAVGGAAGYAGGNYLVRDNQNFQTTAEGLRADIDAAKQDTQRLAAGVTSARSVLSYQQSETQRLNAAYRANNLELNQLQAHANNMQRDLEATRDMRNTAQQRVSNLSQSVGTYRDGGLGTGELNSELAKQREFVEALREVEDGMIDVIADIPAEARV